MHAAEESRPDQPVRTFSLMDQHPDGVFEFDLDGRFVAGNHALVRMTGYTQQELLGVPFGHLIHPDDHDRVTREFEQAVAGTARHYEAVGVRKDGAPVPIEVTNLPIVVAGDVVGVYGIARDITARRAIEADLARRASLERLAGQVARLAGWRYDLATGRAYWSHEAGAILGIVHGKTPPVAALLGQCSRADRRRVIRAAAGCLRSGASFTLEMACVALDGRTLWVRLAGEPERADDGRLIGLRGALQDVTEMRAADVEIARVATRLDAAMHSINDALLTVDHDGRFTYLNPQAERLLRRDAPLLIDRTIWDEFPEAVTTPLYDAYERASTGQVPVDVPEFSFAPLEAWIEARVVPSTEGLTISVRDVSERRALLAAERDSRQRVTEARRTVLHQATHDRLTGLRNRGAALARLEQPGPDGFTVLLIDFDGFRQVNEDLGQTAGDGLLMQAANVLQSMTRHRDMVARVGGDEFVVLLPGHDPLTVDQVADRVLAAFRTPMDVGGERLYVTVSIGISRAYPAMAADAALLHAGVALARAKEQGRDTAVWYDPMIEAEPGKRVGTAAELHDALHSEQLLLHFQPAFDLVTGQPVGAEALVRWQHPERGLVAPGSFIPVAEETGLIGPLGTWCLAEALDAAQPWLEQWPNFTIWVNVAIHQLRRRGLARQVAGLLTHSRTRPAQLGIEITESAFAQDEGTVRRELESIAELGVPIAIDDFGTGYSSLARLGSLPADLLKIDRSFITRLDTDSGRATVAAIVDLAHAVGIMVTAEGVETSDQLTLLREMGCDQASGFRLARPDVAAKLIDGCAQGSEVLLD